MLPIDFNPRRQAVRSFTRLWFPLFALTVGAILRWRLSLPTAAIVWWVCTGVLAVGGVASIRVARAVFVALSLATYPVALVTSFVVLAIMFAGVITPLGVFLRFRGHDPLQLRRRPVTSYWQSYDQDDDPERAIRQF